MCIITTIATITIIIVNDVLLSVFLSSFLSFNLKLNNPLYIYIFPKLSYKMSVLGLIRTKVTSPRGRFDPIEMIIFYKL